MYRTEGCAEQGGRTLRRKARRGSPPALGRGQGKLTIEAAPAFQGTLTMMARYTYKGRTITHSSDDTFDPVRLSQIVGNNLPEYMRKDLNNIPDIDKDVAVFDRTRTKELTDFLLGENSSGNKPALVVCEGGNTAALDKNTSNHTTPFALQMLSEDMQRVIHFNHTAKLPEGSFIFRHAVPMSSEVIAEGSSLERGNPGPSPDYTPNRRRFMLRGLLGGLGIAGSLAPSSLSGCKKETPSEPVASSGDTVESQEAKEMRIRAEIQALLQNSGENVDDDPMLNLTAPITSMLEYTIVTGERRTVKMKFAKTRTLLLLLLLAFSTSWASTIQWSMKSPMPTGRDAMGIGVLDGKIYTISGRQGRNEREVEVYDPSDDSWEVLPDIPWDTFWPFERSIRNAGTAVVNGSIYLFSL